MTVTADASLTVTADALDLAVGALVDQLVRCGVRDVSACPGSRSTPLALELAQRPDLRLWMHLDERSAAYFALGMAKARRAPVGLLATSGTAAANFLPAVVEAYYARVPLVVLTADRPHELRDCGAPQTIDQVGLYGKHVRWFFDLAEPEATPEYVRHVRALAARAAAVADGPPAGPVHLNWPFREPLVPASPGLALHADAALDASAPGPIVSAGRRAPEPELVAQLAARLAQQPRGLIICGPQADPDLPPAVAALAERLAYPILADPLSGLRRGRHSRRAVLDAYDASLRDPDLVARLAPEVVLRFGAMPTSKSLLLFLERHAAAHQVLVDGGGGWNEPTGLARAVLHVDERRLCQALLAALPAQQTSDWLDDWLATNRATRAALDAYLADLDDELFEGKVFAELAAALPDGATLYVGNSMPVRDLDAFFPAGEREVRVLANRGANGIDGVVSSAFGARAASDGPVVLAIGDISFYHDLNGLLAARRHQLDLTIVLLNNDGGGIFSFLPQADLPDHFEALFGTPHGLDFRPFVEGHGGQFRRIESWPDFRAGLRAALATPGLHVLEVPTERRRNVALHRAAWQAVADARRLAAVAR